jgi:hypothetical protein
MSNATQVAIRAGVPTGPTGATTPCWPWRVDYLDLEPQTVVVHKESGNQGEVTAEENNMSVSLGAPIGLDEDDDIQRLRELFMEQLRLVEPGLDLALYGGRDKVLHWEVVIRYFAAILATGAPPGIRAGVGKVQGGIAPQLGNEMQVALARHLQSWMMAKMTI